MTGAINTRSVSFALGLLCTCLALMRHGLTEAQGSTSAPTPGAPSSWAVTSDGKTTSQLNTTSGRNSTMAPVILCYNDTGSNMTCSSGTGICYASYTLASGAMSLSCRSLNATAAPVCASSFAVTSAGGQGRCEFCCAGAPLCNRDRLGPWMKATCCTGSQGQNQPVCSSEASRVVVVTVTSVIVCAIVKMMVS